MSVTPTIAEPRTKDRFFYHVTDPVGTVYTVDGTDWVLTKNPRQNGPELIFVCDKCSVIVAPNGAFDMTYPFRVNRGYRTFEEAVRNAMANHEALLEQARALVAKYG